MKFKDLMLIGGAAAALYLLTRKKTAADLVDSGAVYTPGLTGTTDLNIGQTITAITELVQNVGAPFITGAPGSSPREGYTWSVFDMAFIRNDLYNPGQSQQIYTGYNSDNGGAWSGWIGGHYVKW